MFEYVALPGGCACARAWLRGYILHRSILASLDMTHINPCHRLSKRKASKRKPLALFLKVVSEIQITATINNIHLLRLYIRQTNNLPVSHFRHLYRIDFLLHNFEIGDSVEDP